MADELKEHGYDREAEFFHKKNKELLDKMRATLDAERKKTAAKAPSNPHFMKCPKCGADMKEADRGGVKVDHCPGCGGIYFDRGELELLIEAEGSKSLLGGLKGLFKK